MTDDINLHCIVCGGTGEVKTYYYKARLRYYVQCPVCGRIGRDGRKERDAKIYWEIDNTPLSD